MTQYVDLINQQLETYPMVAIITKTQKQAEALYHRLKARITVNLLTQDSRSLKKGLCILPIYLAKGLEFDSVIVDNVSKENYPQSGDREILYTIASRAMHELNLVVPTQLPTFLNKQKA
ncbi:ATP-binding domain-containing protein [Holzapfeliella sp. He02]|uniref:ATP-binding domain-containing protein n=1 Tax=Holzapfeliella saturejae TaxID=3082953 RepID=A0ABU8SF77_9LACO